MTDHLKTIREALTVLYGNSHCFTEARKAHTNAALDALEQAMREPVMWQRRMRPTWAHGNAFWGPWVECSEGSAKDCWKTPLLHDWAYEARALYTAAPPVQQAQRPDFHDEWTGYLKDGETPFERFRRERKDLDALTKLYQRALEENEQLKAQPAQQAQPTDTERAYLIGFADGKKAQAEAVPQWVSCRCFDEAAKRLCADKGKCIRVEAFAAAPQPKEQSNAVCRSDGKCQYAIDHDAENLGHCPTGKCVMPRQAETALQPKGGV